MHSSLSQGILLIGKLIVDHGEIKKKALLFISRCPRLSITSNQKTDWQDDRGILFQLTSQETPNRSPVRRQPL